MRGGGDRRLTQRVRTTGSRTAGQARWLERQLRQPAEVRLLVSSIQVVADDHHWEHWSNFPHERTRLLHLLRETRAGGVIALLGYPLYDLTSSGMNMSHPLNNADPARRRVVPEAIFENNFGLVRIDWSARDPALALEIVTVDGRTALRHPFRLSELQPP